jgi:tryptophanyl-tRNA synthetase
LQHLEFTRDVAARFNHKMGEVFVIPKEDLQQETQLIPGIDGQKMSKSRNNYIDIFLPEKALKKQIMKIVTDTKGLDDEKDPSTCNVFQLYKLIASPVQRMQMEVNYKTKGYGYGHAKTELLQLILTHFAKERELFNYYQENPSKVDEILAEGAKKAREIAKVTLNRTRKAIGFYPN